MELSEQLKSLRGKLSAENDLGGQRDASKIADLEQQIADLQAEARAQEQEEKVESIVLPYDFSEVFGDPRANEMIVELIKDFQRQAFADHNAEVETLIAEHKAEIQLVTSDRNQAKERLQLLSDNLGEEKQAHNEVLALLNETKLRLNDAESKRDAAVRHAEGLETLLSEKQEHIQTLRDEIAIGAKAAINVTNISPSDRLAQLVQDSKNAKVKSALDIALENAAPFRGKVTRDGEVVAQLEVPQVSPFPVINPSGNTDLQLVASPIAIIPTNDSEVTPTEALSSLPTGLVEGSPSEDGQGEKSLEERVKLLELHVFGA